MGVDSFRSGLRASRLKICLADSSFSTRENSLFILTTENGTTIQREGLLCLGCLFIRFKVRDSH